MKTFKSILVEYKACVLAIDWAENKTVEQIVKECHRGDWLLWLAKKIDIPIKPLTLAKARCAKTVIHLMKDQRGIDAVQMAERFGLTDEISLDDLRNAADAAAYTAAHAAAYAAHAAAHAAAYAAHAAAAAAAAAHAAAAAAYADADADAARIKNQKETADICREIVGQLIIDKVNTLLK
jgi:hypothetical protein